MKTCSKAATVAQDALYAIQTIHAFGAGPKVVKWYHQYLRTAHKEGNKRHQSSGYFSQTTIFSNWLEMLLRSGRAIDFTRVAKFRMLELCSSLFSV